MSLLRFVGCSSWRLAVDASIHNNLWIHCSSPTLGRTHDPPTPPRRPLRPRYRDHRHPTRRCQPRWGDPAGYSQRHDRAIGIGHVDRRTHTTTYQRSLFPTWDTISGSCDTRETVLKRDGTNVVVNSACAATAGTWHSPYDGATSTAASDVDIDHMVTLKNAWISGAWAWTTS